MVCKEATYWKISFLESLRNSSFNCAICSSVSNSQYFQSCCLKLSISCNINKIILYQIKTNITHLTYLTSTLNKLCLGFYLVSCIIFFFSCNNASANYNTSSSSIFWNVSVSKYCELLQVSFISFINFSSVPFGITFAWIFG